MTTSDEQLRFPLGRFQRQDIYSAADRAVHIERLASQPSRLIATVSGFSNEDWGQAYRPGGWTTAQLVHHVADSHVNCYIRVKVGLTEVQPTIKPYDQDAWVTLADSALSPLISLTMLEATHARLVEVLRHAAPNDFTRTINHPENGVMTIDQVVAMYAWHGDHHIAQLARFRDAHPRHALSQGVN